MDIKNILVSENHKNNPDTISKEEYLKKIYDIKKTTFPIVAGRVGVGMSFDTKKLSVAYFNFIGQLDNFISMVEKATESFISDIFIDW